MKKTSLNELMGSSGSAAKRKDLSLSDLGDLLGERMPKLEFTPIGRFRLMTALHNRFGEGYRNLPGIDKIMRDFDEEAKFAIKVQEMKQIKARGK